jgi:NAD(P)H-flavin reductase
MKVEIKGNEVVITLPLNNPLVPSKSGKSLMVASSNGIVATPCVYQNKPLKVGANVFVDL